MERMTHKARLRYWVEALHRCAQECAERGITKQQWIAEQGVSAKTFYNWQRRIREAASEQMESKAVVPASESLFSILPNGLRCGMIRETKRGMSDEEKLSERYYAGTV